MRLQELKETVNCKYCSRPATQEVVWADGRATIPVCNQHATSAKQELKQKNEKVTQVRAL